MSELDPAEIFRLEAADLMEQLETALLDLDRSPGDLSLVDGAFRALHTLKGSGAMFGFTRVASFIHDFETAFDRIRKGQASANPDVVKVALDAQDHIRALIESPNTADDAAGRAILDRLARATSAEPASAVPAPSAPSSAPAPAAPTRWHLDFAFDAETLINGSNPLLMLDELRAMGPCAVVADWVNVPPLRELNPQLLYLTFKVDVTAQASRAAFEEVFMFVLDDMRLEITQSEGSAPEAVAPAAEAAPSPPQPQPEQPVAVKPDDAKPADTKPVDVKPAAGDAAKAAPARAPAKDLATIKVPAERLDEMMDRVGELVIVQARLSQVAANGGNEDVIKSVAEDIARLTSGLREAMMGIRMVPIGSLFSRFRRLLHDLSNQLGKDIEFVTVGDETELDKTMIERLADPLVHILRNSADHGLEDRETRLRAGKSASGQIKIVARHAGAEVLLSVVDDGRGLDAKRIRQKAEENGLVAPGATLSDEETYALIFAPGFSTAKEVSALSGRGVGMDVVKRTIESMRGAIDVATVLGQGTTITLRLPLTLAIIEGLLVRVAETRYVIPLTAVEECVELTEEDDVRSEGRSFLNIRGDLIPFLRLRELFGEDGQADRYQKVVIVSTGDARVGLAVDQIIGSHQTVIKSLSKLHADVASFSGATILGDGAVALILDIGHVVSFGQTLESRHHQKQMEMA